MSERQERCETCRFWDTEYTGGHTLLEGQGRCHRFPPVGYDEACTSAVFPIVDTYDWCGEWRDRVAKSQAADILSLPVSSISDGQHWQWIFRELGVDTVGQLCEKTSLELTDNRIFSRSRLVYLRGRLALFGLKLKGD